MKHALLLLALSVASTSGLATANFPPVVHRVLGLDADPGCTLCHSRAEGGGSANKPVARSLKDAGLRMGDEASLEAALAQLEADGTDSDGDGTGDVDELVAGTDPNTADGGEGEGEPVQYGFGCGSTPALPVGSLAFVLLALRRWRRAPCLRR